MDHDTDTSGGPKRSVKDILLWPALILFLLLSSLAAVHWYLQLDLEGFSIAVFSPFGLMAASLCHMLALGAVSLSWYWNLRLHGVEEISVRHSIIMVGFSSIGKYTPGKIWGVVARGLVLFRLTGRTNHIVQATLTEQIALLHSGLWLAGLSLLLQFAHPLPVAGFLIFGLVTVYPAAHSGRFIKNFLHALDHKHQFAERVSDQGLRNAYPPVFFGLCVTWVLTSASLWFCIHAYDGATVPSYSQVLLVGIASLLGGFAAFFAPAGLGVREGIVVGMLTPYVGLTPALYISLLHRLVTTALDVVLGLCSLLMSKTRTTMGKAGI